VILNVVLLASLAALAGPAPQEQAAPRSLEAQSERDQARALLGSGHPVEALPHARLAAVLDPKNADSQTLWGYALLATGGLEEATGAFDRALAISPGLLEARAGLAQAYGFLGDARAELEFAAVLKAAPGQPRYRKLYAEFLWNKGEAVRGNREMEKALELAPAAAGLRLEYGMELHAQGRFVDAARELARARKDGATDPILLYDLGSAELENGNFPAAERWLKEAIAQAPKDAAPRQILGLVYLVTGRPAEARKELQAGAAADPSSAAMQLDLGRATEALGDLAGAEAAYRRALELSPGLYRVHYLLGALLSRQRRTEEARAEMALYEKAYQEEQSRVYQEASLRVELNLGWTLLHQGNLDDALVQFERHPDQLEALRGSAEALSRMGRHAEAVAALEKALVLAPEDRTLRYAIARERRSERPS
jgi:tetratricopeptide (TPR) repeat protein